MFDVIGYWFMFTIFASPLLLCSGFLLTTLVAFEINRLMGKEIVDVRDLKIVKLITKFVDYFDFIAVALLIMSLIWGGVSICILLVDGAGKFLEILQTLANNSKGFGIWLLIPFVYVLLANTVVKPLIDKCITVKSKLDKLK